MHGFHALDCGDRVRDPLRVASSAMATENVVYIDFNKQPIYEIGSALVATLCYSAPGDTFNEREKAQTALCAWGLRTRAQVDLDWANIYVPIKPCNVAPSNEEVDRALKGVNRRMRDRLAAGRILMPFLQKSLTGELPIIGGRPMKPTLNKLAPYVLKHPGVGDVDNVKSRLWSPSRNVLHLAGAFEFAHDVLHKGGQQLDFTTMIWNETFIRFVLHVAQDAEALIVKSCSDRELKIDPTSLIRIRVITKLSRSEPVSLNDPDSKTSTGDDVAHDTPKENPRAAG